jgi:hypothetical protein
MGDREGDQEDLLSFDANAFDFDAIGDLGSVFAEPSQELGLDDSHFSLGVTPNRVCSDEEEQKEEDEEDDQGSGQENVLKSTMQGEFNASHNKLLYLEGLSGCWLVYEPSTQLMCKPDDKCSILTVSFVKRSTWSGVGAGTEMMLDPFWTCMLWWLLPKLLVRSIASSRRTVATCGSPK